MSSKKNTKTGQFQKQQDEGTLTRASGITVDSALKTLSSAQAAIGKTLAGVGEQVQSQLQELDTVTKAVQLKKDELAQIHGVEVVAKSIEEMEQEFVSRRELATTNFRAFQVEQEVARTDANRNFSQFLAQQKANQDQANAEWTYNFTQEQKKARDAFAEEMRVLRAQERDRSEIQAKNWAAREEELKKNEALFAELQQKVAAFPAILEDAKAKAASIAGNSVKHDFEHRLALLQKDTEVAQKMAENTINSLNKQLDNSNAAIAVLQTKLTDAEKKVETIATKALEAASGRQALAELQGFRSDNGTQSTRKA